MKKQWHYLLTFFWICLFTFCLCTGNVSAEGESTEQTAYENGLAYSTEGMPSGTCKIVDAEYNRETYTIPSTHNGLKVTRIDNDVFRGNMNLETITIPDSVTEIGSQAFLDCPNLKSVKLGSNLKKIENNAFSCCGNLVSIVIPDSVTMMEEAVFMDCSHLKNVTLSKNINAILSGTFMGTAIESIVIPDKVVTISNGAFYTAVQLKQITLPASLKQVNMSAFEGTALISVIYKGTQEQRKQISIDSGNDKLINASWSYASASASAPVITQQPADQTVSEGGKAAFTVKATGSGLKYQWYFKLPDRLFFEVWGGRTTDSFTYAPTTAKSGMQAYCVITDANGASVVSRTMTLLVKASAKTVITQQPANLTANEGQTVTFSIKATGTGLTYQWYYKMPGQSSFTLWSGRTAASFNFTPTAAKNGMQVCCIVKGSGGDSVKSSVATLTVKTKLEITQQPANVTVEEGQATTFSIKAVGTGLKYQWYYKMPGQSSFTLWSGRTAASFNFTPTAAKNGMQICCIVKDANGASIKSSIATVTVKSRLEITQQPMSLTTTEGGSVTFSLKAKGSGLTYQWYFKKAGSSAFSAWTGRTTASFSYKPGIDKNGMQIYCIVSDADGNKVQSAVVTLTVKQDVKVGSFILFGTYEQDNNLSNGKEAIEWLVLDKKGDKALVISRYALDAMAYNQNDAPVTWKDSTLRTWLNGSFLNTAFSSSEKNQILTTNVVAHTNPEYSTYAGEDTQDRIFLMSSREAAQYFPSDESRRCGLTPYAQAQGGSTSSSYAVNGRSSCYWWLRTPGKAPHTAAVVRPSGPVLASGFNVNSSVDCVRPMMWVNL